MRRNVSLEVTDPRRFGDGVAVDVAFLVCVIPARFGLAFPAESRNQRRALPRSTADEFVGCTVLALATVYAYARASSVTIGLRRAATALAPRWLCAKPTHEIIKKSAENHPRIVCRRWVPAQARVCSQLRSGYREKRSRPEVKSASTAQRKCLGFRTLVGPATFLSASARRAW